MPTEEYSESYPQQYQTTRSRTYEYVDPNKPDLVTVYKVPTTPYKWSDTVTKGVNPDWRADIRNNRQAGTSLSGQRQDRLLAMPSYCRVVYKSPSSVAAIVYEGLYTASVPPSSASYPESDANNEAMSRFLKKLIEQQRAIQGGVVLGELRETLHMLRNPAKALRRGIDDWSRFARKRVRQKRQFPRTKKNIRAANRVLRESWLEHVFGWGPLINDISDAGNAINRMDYWDIGREVLFGVGEAQGVISNVVGTTALSGVKMVTEVTNSVTSTVKYLGATRALVRTPVQFQRRLLGFSWEDFAPTVWELIPYSFLVDYFTNIGDIISGWSYGRAGLAWSIKTVHNEILVTRRWTYKPSTSQYYLSHVSPGLYYARRKTVNRTPYSSGFTPSVSFRIPGLGVRWINIAALASARFLR